MTVQDVSGRKIIFELRKRDGKQRHWLRNALTVWWAEPTRKNVSKK
jgi:hypothetical protein